jgi:nucleoside-diphosphate-sugar epimerase
MDVVSAFVKSVENEECHGTFNVGSGTLTSVARIAQIVEQAVRNDNNFSAQLSANLIEGNSSLGMWADTSRSGEQLGWTPQIELVEGIKRTCRAAWK